METFSDQLAKTVQEIILHSITEQLYSFAKNVVELPELKGVTVEEIIECWNSNSDFKVETFPSNDEVVAETPSRKPRAQTDKSRKCQVPKQRGDNKGEPCSKNCVTGTEFCPEHLKKNQPSSASSVMSRGSEENGGECSHLLQNGPNKGNPCGKKITSGSWCTVHAKKH